ncbi:MAG: c-type cytochrome [Gemmatimonadota bacterium]
MAPPMFLARHALLSALACLLAAAVAPADAQRRRGGVEAEGFTNLMVLPGDTSREDLQVVMGDFSAALGVNCGFCHVTGPERDFASDEKPHKTTARDMMRLTAQVNESLQRAGVTDPNARVECATCHRGMAEPQTLRRALVQSFQADGADSAVAYYRQLRGTYYGRALDFGEPTLLQVIDDLGRSGAAAEAQAALARLNLEYFPQSAGSHLQLARALARSGDQAGARQHAEEAQQLAGDDRWLQRQVRQVLDELGQ